MSQNSVAGAENRTVYRTCPLCEATCGLEITLKGDRVTRIRGDKEDVLSRGHLCPKGVALAEMDRDPDRLREPVIRRGDTWQEVSWDDAFAEIERRLVPILDKHGRDSTAVYLGNAVTHIISGGPYIRPLLKMLRTKNVYSSSTVDQMPKHVSSGLLFGSAATIPVPDIDRTDYLLILGANPWQSNGSLCTAPNFPGRIRAVRSRGGKVAVVDPRRTRTGREADEHFFIKPGTDAFFLFGIVHTLFQEELTSLGRLADHVNGLEPLREACLPFTPEAVESVCSIDASKIKRIAQELSSAPSACVYGRIGTCTVRFGTVNSWLIDVINIHTGNLDNPGGAMFPEPAHTVGRTKPGGKGFATGRWRSRVKGLPEVCREFPVSTLVDEIETPGEGQVRALITIASNPVLTAPNGERVNNALDSLAFMVSVDPYRNETTRHADVILPPEPRFSQGHYDFFFNGLSVRNTAKYSPPIFEPDKDQMKEWEILLRLAWVVAGQGSKADPHALEDMMISQVINSAVKDESSPVACRDPRELMQTLAGRHGPERVLDLLLQAGRFGEGFGSNPGGLSLEKLISNPHGIDLGPLRPQIPNILKTPSEKIEMAPKQILDALPDLLKSLNNSDRTGYLLVGRRHLRSCNSWGHNTETLLKGRDLCTLQIHPDDADRLGLTAGGFARIASRVGSVKAPVEITEHIMPGVVSLPYGWGHDVEGTKLSVAKAHPGVNSNILTDDQQMDTISGTSVLNGIPVTVEKQSE